MYPLDPKKGLYFIRPSILELQNLKLKKNNTYLNTSNSNMKIYVVKIKSRSENNDLIKRLNVYIAKNEMFERKLSLILERTITSMWL